MVQNCCCYGCNEKYERGGTVTFHSFPKDEQRAKIWLQKINRENFVHSRYTKVCSKHFTEDCFDREKFGGVWLKNDAVPTIFDSPQDPPKATSRKRPAKRRLHVQPRVSPHSVKDNSQNQNEKLTSIMSRNVPILPAPSPSANGEPNYSIWCIPLLPPLVAKPEQTQPADERNSDTTTVVDESNSVQNDSATNKIEWGISTKKESRESPHGENWDNFLCGAVKQEQECEYTSVKEEPIEDPDESARSAAGEEYEYTSVKEEPVEDPDESAFSAAGEQCEYISVKEEPIEDPDESTHSAVGEDCGYTLVKQEPADDSTHLPAAEVCDRITVKMEPKAEYEEDSQGTHRLQGPEYIELKGEPLEQEQEPATDTLHGSLCFW